MSSSGGNWKDFFAAASRGDVELVRFHLENEVDPDYQHPEVMTTALIEAAEKGHDAVVAQLLQGGADPTVRSVMDGWTALEAAVAGGHRSVVERLARQLGVPTPELAKASGPGGRGPGLLSRIGLRRRLPNK